MAGTKVLIDANIYLSAFLSRRVAGLLDALLEIREHVFVSRQLVDEVERNKLRTAASFLGDQVARLKAMGLSATSLDFLALLDAEGQSAGEALDGFLQALRDVESRATSYLASVAASEDPASRRLARLFRQAVEATPEQAARARHRREIGNPPGKTEDVLGDQLTWEAWLDHARDEDRVWIVTADQDFFTRFGGSRFLNPVLQRDMERVHGGAVRARVYDRLAEALEDFQRSTGIAVPSLPASEVLAEISKEERAVRMRPTLDGHWAGPRSTGRAASSEGGPH